MTPRQKIARALMGVKRLHETTPPIDSFSYYENLSPGASAAVDTMDPEATLDFGGLERRSLGGEGRPLNANEQFQFDRFYPQQEQMDDGQAHWKQHLIKNGLLKPY